MIDDVIGRLVAEHERWFPAYQGVPEVGGIERHARRLSDIARVELLFPRGALTVYVKVHRHPSAPAERVHKKAELEFETLAHLYPRFRGVPGCEVARPIAFFPEYPAVVTEAVDGQNLHRLLKREAALWRGPRALARLQDHCRAAGAWLRHFQQFTDQGRESEVPAAALLRTIREDLAFAVDRGLPQSSAADLLRLADVQALAVAGRTFRVVGQHPDYQPDNLLVGPRAVTVLDFTSFRYGPAASDVARFLAYVALLAKNPLYRPARLQRLGQAFLEGYGWGAPEHSAEAVTLYWIFFGLRAARTVMSRGTGRVLRLLATRRTTGLLTGWSRECPDLGTVLANG